MKDMMAPRVLNRQPRWASRLCRLPGIVWTGAAVLLLGAALTGAGLSDPAVEDTRQGAPATTDGESTPPQGNFRVREGTEIVDQLGHFQVSGDRVIFFTADGKRRLVGLENLNLERIARTIGDSHEPLRWGVTGTITEYRGTNFLLIHRAVLKGGTWSPSGGSY